jgi:hypothetical protein
MRVCARARQLGLPAPSSMRSFLWMNTLRKSYRNRINTNFEVFKQEKPEKAHTVQCALGELSAIGFVVVVVVVVVVTGYVFAKNVTRARAAAHLCGWECDWSSSFARTCTRTNCRIPDRRQTLPVPHPKYSPGFEPVSGTARRPET